MSNGASVLVIGNGGREHAICWKLSQSADVANIFAAPGNIGTTSVSKVLNVTLDIKNHSSVVGWSVNQGINLVVVGPEDPLADGLADALAAEGKQLYSCAGEILKIQLLIFLKGISCFGPCKEGAQIESNKEWAKKFMIRHNIPTARFNSFKSAQEAKKFIWSADFPALVVKASGLAAGKGVIVAADREEASRAVDDILTERKFGEAGDSIVIEELLEGEEVSCLAFTDGNTVIPMLPSQDHKRLCDGDEGPNTGGMGAYCPCPLLSLKLQCEVVKDVLQKAVDGLKMEGITFIGVLYAGLMITRFGPKVLEFNCRFGDPETQVILPLLKSDLYHIMLSCCNSTLHEQKLNWEENAYTVGVVMASKGYPQSSTRGCKIEGLDKARTLIFHSGTALDKSGEVVTHGGRILIAVASAPLLAVAAAEARAACEIIQFEGAQYRRDIAFKGIARSLLASGQLTYKSSGVDIAAGDRLVSRIKPASEQTTRPGCLGSLGGFGGFFDPKAAGYKDPLLVSGTDGVGTKLKIAQSCNIHSSIGIDLVAMCVNDILANGAEPLYFLDYFACGRLDLGVACQIIEGVSEGCKQAGCALIGGETAEMPGVYAPGDYDLAGFAVGAVERDHVLPRSDRIVPGDVVIGLPSSGVHSNGFSLLRKVMEKTGFQYSDKAPFSQGNKTFGEELLTPTRIYVKSLLPALRSGKVKAVAHITGGGLTENIPRVLPAAVRVRLDAFTWDILPVFSWLATLGGISEHELSTTFNCGVGMILIVGAEECENVLTLIPAGEEPSIIGRVESSSGDEDKVVIDRFTERMDREMRKFIPKLVEISKHDKKRVAVLISGSGTNLQALIDATVSAANCSSEIVLVISNKPEVAGLERATSAGIPTLVIKHKDFASRVDFDMAVHEALRKANINLVCLAGFMRVLSSEFVDLWSGRLINIHPALLPSFKGTHAHRQALEAGVRVTGCTVHFVEAAVDAGGIIAQEAVQIEQNDTEQTLEERVKTVEHMAYPKALELLASGKVRRGEDGKVVWMS